MVLFFCLGTLIFKLEGWRLQCKRSHQHRYDKEDGQGSQMKLFDIIGIQITKYLLGDLALGIIHVGGMNHAKGIGEIDNLKHMTQPCFLCPNLAVITQLFLELCQAMCQQRSCSVEQRMCMLTIPSPASGIG